MKKISDLKLKSYAIFFERSKKIPIIWLYLGACSINFRYFKLKKEKEEITRKRLCTKFTPFFNTCVRFSMMQRVAQPDDQIDLIIYAIIEGISRTGVKKRFFFMEDSKTLERKVFFTYPFIITLMAIKKEG